MTDDAPVDSAQAAGRHLPWCQVPAPVRAWAEALVGPVASAVTQPGGMSPGCVVRLRGADGRRVFVKAVGAELNERTPELYRREIDLLRGLPAADYRPELVDAYDDGAWVGLALADVEGRYPDLDVPADVGVVRDLLIRQAAELSDTVDEVPPGVPPLAETADIWLRTWLDDPVQEVQPRWLADRYAEFTTRVSSLPRRLPPEQLIHWDVRADNLLVRPDGRVVLFDWGMARVGPIWADLLFLGLSYAEQARFDADAARIAAEVGSGPDPETVDDLLVLAGTRLAWTARFETPGIPAMSAFRRREAGRLLAGARRRTA